MKILALVHRVPFPPNKGEKIRAFHELKYLGDNGHTIDLATFADVEEDLGWRRDLLQFCRDVVIIPQDRRFSRARSVLALPKRKPLSVGYFESSRLRRQVEDWLAERSYDVVFCYSSPMAEYVRKTPRASAMVRIMDFVDVDSDKWLQYAERSGQPKKTLYRYEARSLAVYERAIAEEFDASILVSAAEAAMFEKVAPAARRIVDIPNGVDAEYFGKTERRPRDGARPLIVFVGQMDYFANVEGVVYFAKEVMPLVQKELPGAELRIVGRAPTSEVRRLAELKGVSVTGAVPDIRGHLAEATLMIAPLRIARGVQNKVLEGMAAGVPVVASPEAMEGILANDGEHAIVGKDAPSYAQAIASLAKDEEKMQRIAGAARALVTSRYAWNPAMKKLEALMLELSG